MFNGHEPKKTERELYLLCSNMHIPKEHSFEFIHNFETDKLGAGDKETTWSQFIKKQANGFMKQ